MTTYVQSKWPEIKFEMLKNYDGAQKDIHFMAKYESVAAHEKFMELYWQDDGVKSQLDELISASKAIGSPFLVNDRKHFYQIVDVD